MTSPHYDPKRKIGDFPANERDDVHHCYACLEDLSRYCNDFSGALGLFTLCAQVGHPEWNMIAAKDGAMTIYHFAKAMDGANTWCFRSPTLASMVKRQYLGDGFKLLGSYFPRFEAVRHAVAHAGDITKNPKWLASHSFTGSHHGQAIVLHNVGGMVIRNLLDNNKFKATFDGAIQEYEISDKTLSVLNEIREMFFRAFS